MATSTINRPGLTEADIVNVINNGNKVVANVDLNSITNPGIYVVTNATNYPTQATGRGKLFVIKTDPTDSNYTTQIFLAPFSKIYYRYLEYSSGWQWSSWYAS